MIFHHIKVWHLLAQLDMMHQGGLGGMVCASPIKQGFSYFKGVVVGVPPKGERWKGGINKGFTALKSGGRGKHQQD